MADPLRRRENKGGNELGNATDFFARGGYTGAKQRRLAVTNYWILIFLFRFLVDLFLILGADRMAGFSTEPVGAVLGALTGGIFALGCVIPGFSFLGNPLWRWICLLLVCLFAFGLNRSSISRGVLYLLLSLALEGLVNYGNDRREVSILFGGALYLLCRLGFRKNGLGKSYVNINLAYSGKHYDIIALKDTGNLLTDPVTGENVLVAGADVGCQILGLPENAFRDPAGTLAMAKVPGMRLIPYRSIGESGGLMLALRFRDAKVGNRVRDVLVAFAPEVIGRGEGYRMLTGGTI